MTTTTYTVKWLDTEKCSGWFAFEGTPPIVLGERVGIGSSPVEALSNLVGFLDAR